MISSDFINFIKITFLDIDIQSIRVNDKGWDNDILFVNEEVVFRFPRSELLCKKLQDEVKLLACLRKLDPILQIPNYQQLTNGEITCVKYPLIKGKSLTELGYPNLISNINNAKSLADFLTKLHSIKVYNVKDSQIKLLHSYTYWGTLYQSVSEKILPHLTVEQQSDVNKVFGNFLTSYTNHSFSRCIIHGDLGSSNIIFDQKEDKITGIIDFTDAQLGDPAFDFAGIYWAYGPDFTKQVLFFYETIESKKSIYKRVSTFYGLQPIFHELLHALEKKQTINWNEALSRFFELKMVF